MAKVEDTKLHFMTTYKGIENAFIIDVRTKDEYDAGHIKDAINVNFYDPDFIENMKKVCEGKKPFIYCRSGGRSAKAVQMLKDIGIVSEDMPGGMMAYRDLVG